MAKYKAKIKGCQLIVKVKLSLKERVEERQLALYIGRPMRGLLKARNINRNTIEYSGPMGISLCERLKNPVSKYDFFFVMEQIVDVTQKLKAGGFSVNHLVLDLKNVFINEMTREIQFIYLPLEQQTETDILGFIEKVIYSTVPSAEQDTEYITKFIYFIKSLQNFDAEAIEQFIAREDRKVVSTIKRHNTGQSGFMTDKPADYYAHYNRDEMATSVLEDEATTVLGEDDVQETALLFEGQSDFDEEATSLLVESPPPVHFAELFRCLSGEKIPINKPVFRIGKEKSYSDYFVCNNDKVSRGHADIIARGNHYYIMDLNSKNGTFVNNKQIPVRQETEIFDGDKIRLANEEFEFHI